MHGQCNDKPMVTFPVAERSYLLLDCLVVEARRGNCLLVSGDIRPISPRHLARFEEENRETGKAIERRDMEEKRWNKWRKGRKGGEERGEKGFPLPPKRSADPDCIVHGSVNDSIYDVRLLCECRRSDFTCCFTTSCNSKFCATLETKYHMNTHSCELLPSNFRKQKGTFSVTAETVTFSCGCCQIRNGYFVHHFSPSRLRPIDKNIVFIVDLSESANQLDDVKLALEKILEELAPGDLFNVVAYSGSVQYWNRQKVVAATSVHINSAKSFIRSLRLATTGRHLTGVK